MWQSIDTKILHGDDIWRCRRGARSTTTIENGNQLWIIVGDDDADTECRSDEKDGESCIDCLESILDVSARSLGFARDHRDILRPNDGERCTP